MPLRVDKCSGLSGTGPFIRAFGRTDNTGADSHFILALSGVSTVLGGPTQLPIFFVHRLALFTDSRLHSLSLCVVYCLHPYISHDLECVRPIHAPKLLRLFLQSRHTLIYRSVELALRRSRPSPSCRTFHARLNPFRISSWMSPALNLKRQSINISILLEWSLADSLMVQLEH